MQTPFDGIKVVQCGHAVIGALMAQYFGEFGAEVIKIESHARPDSLRMMSPFKDDIPGVNRSAFWASANANRYSISLNMNNSNGLRIARMLTTRADIIIDNFTPRVMEKWELDFENIKKVNDDVIMLRTCTFGQTGLMRDMPGYGGPLTAIAGFYNITGYPNEYPSGPYGAYTDYIVPRFGALVICAALEYRNRTGTGQCIDLSQYETALQFLAPVILEYSMNNKELSRIGNHSLCAAPHGVYRCKGDDRWCAIDIDTENHWQNLCRIMGNPDWCNEIKFNTMEKRLENIDELDHLIERWTVQFTPEEIIPSLTLAAIPAGIAANGEDLDNDPQLRYRNYYWNLDHPEMGVSAYSSMGITMSECKRKVQRAPMLGEHTEYICTNLLGILDTEFVKLDNDGAFE